MGIRRATILFADIIGCSEVSNNIAITDYDKFIVHFHDIAMKAQELLFPKSRYTVEEFEFSVKGDEVCLILHSGQDVDLNKSDQEEENKLAYQNDVRNAILFAFSLKLLWLVGNHNMERIKSGLLPRDIGIGINYGPVVFATHPATGRQKSSEGFSINLAKRVEGVSREGKCSKVFVSKEIKYLAQQANVAVTFDEGKIYPLKGITTAPYLHEIIEINDSTLITASPVMDELAKIPKEELERYYRTAIVNDQEFWLRKLVGYLLLAVKDERSLELLKSEDVIRNYFEQGNAQYYLGRYQEAIDLYDEVIRLREGLVPEAWNNKGSALYELKRYHEAIECYDKALELTDFKDPEAWNNKGAALSGLKRYREALECCDKALKLRKDYPEAWNNKGNALAGLKRYEEAIKCYDKALKLRKDLPEAWNNKGSALYELKRYHEAIECYDKALELRKDYPDALVNKGAALCEVGRLENKRQLFSEAVECCDNALELRKDYPTAWYNKACAFAGLKEKENMLEALKEAVRLDATTKEEAQKDEDFKAYWEDEDFKAVVG